MFWYKSVGADAGSLLIESVLFLHHAKNSALGALGPGIVARSVVSKSLSMLSKMRAMVWIEFVFLVWPLCLYQCRVSVLDRHQRSLCPRRLCAKSRVIEKETPRISLILF